MAGFKPNKRGLDQLQKHLQRELNKRPVHIPVVTDPPACGTPPRHSTTINNGPVFYSSADGAQLAWNNNTVSQQQVRETVARGYESVAEAMAGLISRLDALNLPNPERKEVEAATRDALLEVVADQPNVHKIRAARVLLVRALAPVAAGLVKDGSDAAWARSAIAGLGEGS